MRMVFLLLRNQSKISDIKQIVSDVNRVGTFLSSLVVTKCVFVDSDCWVRKALTDEKLFLVKIFNW